MTLKVLVTGYPNSGTSFLCNLIVELGLSPGKLENLKSADGHNRFGYYENLRLRNYLWDNLSMNGLKIWQPNVIENKQIELASLNLSNIQKILGQLILSEEIEVYKDNFLPFYYQLFPKTSKIIIIERNDRDVYASPQKGGHSSLNVSFETLRETKQKYCSLCSKMQKERDVLWVKYENFGTDFEIEVQRIVDFLKIENKPNLECIFQPRKAGEEVANQNYSKLHNFKKALLKIVNKLFIN